jgi:transcriptional regulator with XRE-family HTH domain
LRAGLSQRVLAERAATSQPAVARYERGQATPSWETLERLTEACGRRLLLSSEVIPEASEVEPAELAGADFLGWRVQRFETGAGPLDVVPHAAGIGGFEDVATFELTLGDFRVRVLTLDEVIASKEELGRPKDLAALPALYAARDAGRSRRDDEREA